MKHLTSTTRQRPGKGNGNVRRLCAIVIDVQLISQGTKSTFSKCRELRLCVNRYIECIIHLVSTWILPSQDDKHELGGICHSIFICPFTLHLYLSYVLSSLSSIFFPWNILDFFLQPFLPPPYKTGMSSHWPHGHIFTLDALECYCFWPKCWIMSRHRFWHQMDWVWILTLPHTNNFISLNTSLGLHIFICKTMSIRRTALTVWVSWELKEFT